MRLIDADALIDSVRIPMIDRLTNAIQLGQEYLYADVPSITLTQISNAPTIKAIPVSFINDMIVLYEKVELPYGASVLDCLIDDWHDELKYGRGFTQEEKEIIGGSNETD